MGSVTDWCAEATPPDRGSPAEETSNRDDTAVRRHHLGDDRQSEAGSSAAAGAIESSRTKRSNTRVRSLAAIPGPSSLTAMIASGRRPTQTSTREVAAGWRCPASCG